MNNVCSSPVPGSPRSLLPVVVCKASALRAVSYNSKVLSSTARTKYESPDVKPAGAVPPSFSTLYSTLKPVFNLCRGTVI